MKLLDVATVERDAQLRDYEPRRALECGMEILLSEFCDDTPENLAVVGDADSGPGDYAVRSFPIVAFLRQGVFCEQPGDAAWFEGAFRNHLEYALTYALTVEHIADTEVWTNGPGVRSVAVTGGAGATTAQKGAAVAAGRRLWFKSVVTDDPQGPILHVPPSQLPAFKESGVVLDQDRTVWGDRVVCGDGYDEHPQVFWSGKINIKIGPYVTDNVPRARRNDVTRVSDTGASIDIVPCTIVRIGDYA